MSAEYGSNGPQAVVPGDRSNAGAAILLVEPDSDLCKVIAASLRIYEWRVIQATSPSSATEKLGEGDVDVLLLGMGASPESNSELVEAYRQADHEQGAGMVLLMTSQRIQEYWRERLRPDAVIYKPFDMRYLCQRIAQLIETSGERI
jgi:DNA-binding response OmpR family regulator